MGSEKSRWIQRKRSQRQGIKNKAGGIKRTDGRVTRAGTSLCFGVIRNLSLHGFDQRVLARDHGVLFAVARCELVFLRPARLDDLLIVRTRAVAHGGARVEMAQRIECDGALLVEIELVLAVLRADDLRPTRLPEPLRLVFARLQ